MKCPNCNKSLGCGCQVKTASNGKKCCATCLSAVEAEIKKTNPKNG